MVDTWAPEKLRGYAFTIAYRMLGSVGEAEDIVQEAMIRLHATDPAEVRSPTAYTATVTRDRKSTRLNSSHPSISYAVFCLKKKKIRNGRLRQLSSKECWSERAGNMS